MSAKISVHIDLLGTIAKDIKKDVNKIRNNRNLSELFVVDRINEAIGFDPPEYTKSEFLEVLFNVKHESEIRIGIIDKKISNKGGSHLYLPISENVVLISIFGMKNLLKNEDLSMYNYLLSMIYKFVILKHIECDFTDITIHHPMHKHCLFAKCDDKEDIVQVLSAAGICTSCRGTIEKRPVFLGFFEAANKEIKHIKKPIFYKIKDWVERHPIVSLVIFCLTSIFLGLLSNVIYGILKG